MYNCIYIYINAFLYSICNFPIYSSLYVSPIYSLYIQMHMYNIFTYTYLVELSLIDLGPPTQSSLVPNQLDYNPNSVKLNNSIRARI